MYTVLATRKGTAEFITGQNPGDCERIADGKGYARYEDALGGVFGKLQGEWLFLRQKKSGYKNEHLPWCDKKVDVHNHDPKCTCGYKS